MIAQEIIHLIGNIWQCASLNHDCADAILISLYIVKWSKSDCRYYRVLDNERGNMDKIFSTHQLQVHWISCSLYKVFVDLKMAFNTVNRDGLWIILGKLQCPPCLLKCFQKGTATWREDITISLLYQCFLHLMMV